MANYKVVDVEQLDSDLTVVADAIREKGGTTEQLAFPNGMADAVRGIQSGGTGDLYKAYMNYMVGDSHLNYDIEYFEEPLYDDSGKQIGYSSYYRALVNSNGLEYELLPNRSSPTSFVIPNGIKTSNIFRKRFNAEYYIKDGVKCLNFKLSDITTPMAAARSSYVIFDFSKLEFDATYQNGDLIFFYWDDSLTTSTIPRLIYFPDYLYINSNKYILQISTTNVSNYSEYLLEHGIHFGKCVENFKTTSIRYTMHGYINRDISVTVKKGFYGTLYLSKIPMSIETMVGIFENLKDLTGTDEQYTINIGPENLEKLTQEQLEIATNKGWVVT